MIYPQKSKSIFYVLIASSIALTFLLLHFAGVGIPSNYLIKIESFQANAGNDVLTLPQALISKTADTQLQGNFILPEAAFDKLDNEIFAYIPKFDGKLNIKADGIVIFSATSPSYLGGSGFALFQVALQEDGKFPDLEFTIQENSKRFVLISTIFLGSKEDFLGPIRGQNLAEFLSVLIFGMNATIMLISVIMFVNKIQTYTAITCFITSVIIALSELHALSSFMSIPDSTFLLITLSTPILTANIWLFGESLRVTEQPAAFWKIQLFSIVTVLMLAVLNSSVLKDFRTLPLVIGIVFIILVFSAAIRFVVIGWKISNINLLSFGLMLLIFIFSAAHDVVMRFNYFGNDQYLLPVGRFLFILVCIIILSSYSHAGMKLVINSNTNLRLALEARTKELNVQFLKNQNLIALKAVAVEKRRMREEFDEDLHDGVLSYISVINVLTEDSTEKNLLEINKLSRFASNEIRLMMETSDKQPMLLLTAIALLRRQFIDRFSEMGIDIHFDVVNLSEVREIDYKVVVECMRILQELVHNAAVRAGSRRIEISGVPMSTQGTDELNQQGFRLAVSNTGGKTYDPSFSTGNGIRNVVNRTDRIGGSFQITPIDGGALATLIWPAANAV